MELLKQGDRKAFAYLYDNYSRAIMGVIFAIVNNQEEAEDLLQMTFVKVWRNFPSYKKEKGRLFTWMLNIARNIAIDHTRSKEGKAEKNIRKIESVTYEVNLKHSEQVSYDHIGLKGMVENLKEEHQAIIRLAYFEGYTQEEIAGKMNIPLGTVKTRVRQAISQLRNLIKT